MEATVRQLMGTRTRACATDPRHACHWLEAATWCFKSAGECLSIHPLLSSRNTMDALKALANACPRVGSQYSVVRIIEEFLHDDTIGVVPSLNLYISNSSVSWRVRKTHLAATVSIHAFRFIFILKRRFSSSRRLPTCRTRSSTQDSRRQER